MKSMQELSELSFQLFCKYETIPNLKVYLTKEIEKNTVSDIRWLLQMESESIHT